MSSESREKIEQLLKYINFNAQDKLISQETCNQIFDHLHDPLLKQLIESNEKRKNAIEFYTNINEQLKNVCTYEQLKDVIVHMFHKESNSEFTEITSSIVLSCTQMLTYRIFQMCLKYSPRDLTSELSIDDSAEHTSSVGFTEFRKIGKEIEKERNISFN